MWWCGCNYAAGRYSSQHRRALEVSLLRWLCAKLPNIASGAVSTLGALVRGPCRDGVLLCQLVGHSTGQRLRPAVAHVRSESSALANFRAAITHLQQFPQMDQRHLAPADKVAEQLLAGSMASSGTRWLTVMAQTAGQWHALINCYGRHRHTTGHLAAAA